MDRDIRKRGRIQRKRVVGLSSSGDNRRRGKLVKKKKKIMAGIRKKLQRDHVFHYLSRHVGKGLRDTIRRSHM